MKDTWVCLSMPALFSILVMYSFSYSAALPTVVVVTRLALLSLVSRAMSVCVPSCLYFCLELLDNCEPRFELSAFDTYNMPTKNENNRALTLCKIHIKYLFLSYFGCWRRGIFLDEKKIRDGDIEKLI